MVMFGFEWGIQGWLWSVCVGYGVATLPALGVLVWTRIGLRQSGVVINNWCKPVVCWAVDGQESVLVPPGIFGFWWCGLSGFGPGAPELTCAVLNVVVSGLVLMLDGPEYEF